LSTITDVHTIGVTVADQDQALSFYRDVLGFEVRLDAVAGPMRWLEVVPPVQESPMFTFDDPDGNQFVVIEQADPGGRAQRRRHQRRRPSTGTSSPG
jgi:catechol 2,3-dioxygenase-like lactoylglutathione lyase family enzyme